MGQRIRERREPSEAGEVIPETSKIPKSGIPSAPTTEQGVQALWPPGVMPVIDPIRRMDSLFEINL